MKNILKKRCIICQNSKWRIFYRFDPCYTLWRCTSCGLIILHPQPSKEELVALYGMDYFSKHLQNQMPLSDREIESQIGRNYRFVEWLNKSIAKKSKGKLLEIGCATGFLMKAFERSGWQMTGIEFSEEASDYARNRLHLNVSTGSVTQKILAKRIFDGVLMLHTLEHLAEPGDALSILFDHLSADGFLIIQVPNVGSLEARCLGRRWEAWRIPFHFYQFSSSTLKKLLEVHGYQIIRLEYSLPSIVMRFSLKILKKSNIKHHLKTENAHEPKKSFSFHKTIISFLKKIPIGRDVTIIAVKGHL